MPKPRKAQVSLADTNYYHCISRCVRRAYLCGDDQVTGKNFDHRKQWLVDRLHFLARVFAIDICAYAVMSNHYHIVVHIDTDKAKQWSDQEVVQRWTQLFKRPYLIQQFINNKPLDAAQAKTVNEIISVYRQRLHDLSWFMRCLNEPIARDANKEDQCTGRFWEGRFKSQPLLDECALLSCMAYVDLNPIRAGICDSLEESDFTSIQQRLFSNAQYRATNESRDTVHSSQSSNAYRHKLHPFLGKQSPNVKLKGIFYSEVDYFELVDWTGRAVREDKKGFIPSTVAKVLDQLALPPQVWLELIGNPSRAAKILRNAA